MMPNDDHPWRMGGFHLLQFLLIEMQPKRTEIQPQGPGNRIEQDSLYTAQLMDNRAICIKGIVIVTWCVIHDPSFACQFPSIIVQISDDELKKQHHLSTAACSAIHSSVNSLPAGPDGTPCRDWSLSVSEILVHRRKSPCRPPKPGHSLDHRACVRSARGNYRGLWRGWKAYAD